MASVTIGGQVREITLSIHALDRAEREIMKRGGRPLLAAFIGKEPGWLAIHEVRWLLWAAWTPALSEERMQTLVDQFYQEGGTLPELHSAVLDALIDGGAIGRRPTSNGEGPPADPPGARASG
jgi:hypothetical protein